ncbi:MAG: TonB-dependent receptor [Polyangia bacterium]
MRAPCLVALCLISWLIGGAVSPPAARAAPTAELRGRVMQRGSIVGVEAARIIVRAAPAPAPALSAPVAPVAPDAAPSSEPPAPREPASEPTFEVTTDRRGRFTLTVPAGPIAVTVQAAGHELLQARETLRPGEIRRVEYLLKALPAYRRPFEVTVRGAPKVEGQRLSLRGEELRTLPGTLGDPFRAIGLLPGVATPLPVLPVYVVRGASPGMNGFFLDGMRVPQLFHVLVGGGVVHARLVDSLDFYPGAYDASFGRYAGGIIDAKTRGGRKDGYHGELELRLYDLSGLVELPLPREVRVTVSGHYGYPGPIVKAFDNRVDVSYWDYQLRLDWKGLTAQALGSYDSVSIADPRLSAMAGMDVQNTFRQTFHRLQLRYVAHLGRHELEAGLVGGLDEMTIFQGNGVRKLSLNLRVNATLRFPGVRLRLGADTELSRFTAENFDSDPVRARPDDLGELGGSRDGVVASAYAVATIDVGRDMTATLSGRVDLYHAGLVTLVGFDPRVQMRSKVSELLTLHGGFGYFQQPPSFPVALPGIDTFALRLGLQRAVHGAAGQEWTLPAAFTFTLTGFYQKYLNANDVVIDFSPTACTSPPPESISGYAAAVTRQVEGSSYGMELMLRRAHGRVTGWIAYTLSRAERNFTCGIRPADYDQPHVLNVVVQVRLPWQLMAGGRLFFSSGRPVTQLEPPDGSSTLRNNVRLPDTVQLDLRLDREWIFRRFALDVFLEVVNSTYGQAVFGLAYPREGSVVRYDMPFLNGFNWILPSIGVRGRF